MQTLRLVLTVTALALAFPGLASAQSTEDLTQQTPEERRAFFDSMSEDERRAFREERRERVERRREHWRNMSQKDREAARQHFRDRRAAMRHKCPPQRERPQP